MKKKRLSSLAAVGLISLWPLAAPAQEPPKVQIPQPGVPQVMTMEGRYVRIAYNNEGFVTLGYKLANLSVGEPWMLLEVGVALRDGVPDYDLTRAAVSLDTPDGKTIPLPTIQEFRKGDLGALQPGRRSSATRSTTSRRTRPGRARSSSSPMWTAGRCPWTRST